MSSTPTTAPTSARPSTPTQPSASTSASEQRIPLMLGALYALILANGVQMAAGLAQVEPHPPGEVLPLLAATAALGMAAVPLVRAGLRPGAWLGIACCALSLIGMGPHKLLLDDGMVIAPLALTGFAFEIVFVVAAIAMLRGASVDSPRQR